MPETLPCPDRFRGLFRKNPCGERKIMTLTERAAYLKGLADGLKLDETKPESQILKEVISLLEDITNDVTDLGDDVRELGEYVEELDDDLASVEDDVYGEDECGCGCEEEDGEYEVECPSCGAIVTFSEDDDPSDLICPECGEHFDCECDGDCDCCGDHEDN